MQCGMVGQRANLQAGDLRVVVFAFVIGICAGVVGGLFRFILAP